MNSGELLHITSALIAFGISGVTIFAMTRRPLHERGIWACTLLVAILLTPFLIPPTHRFIRLLATVTAVMVAVKAYDLSRDDLATETGPIELAIYLGNPFAIVRRLVLAERKPSAAADWKSIAINFTLGVIALFIAFGIFSFNWHRRPTILERSAKTFAVFFVIQFIPNALAALNRRLGIASTDFSKAFVLARTPAEFWRIYNRPAEQFFRVHVFNPAGGRRHFVRATLATFFVSGLIHEYVFDVAAGRLLGTQMLFFMIQGIAVIMTAKLRPNIRISTIAIPATLAFNVLTGTLFMSSMNAVIQIWNQR